jgi:tRNA uridine 5-carboxymethylaminomethyl modification enzyme
MYDRSVVSSFDVIVIGLGHAGCEAALACARMGLATAAVSLRLDRAAVMSCNPAIGGTAKGHLVHELDALGGEMARAADEAGTHFVVLNRSKGPAVRASRVLCDRDAYAAGMQATLRSQPGLTLLEGEVTALNVNGGIIEGVTMLDGQSLSARAVVVTTGTFLQALMHVGQVQEVGGRLGDAAAMGLSTSLRSIGLTLARFKTGTPPRLLKKSIDFDRCERQPSDVTPRPLSLRTSGAFPKRALLDCYVTYTNDAAHRVVRENLHASPLYQGAIVGRGPRYCPSFEDKVVRFAHKPRHTLFLEPEGHDSELVYPAGLSTSLPPEVQVQVLRSVPGLEAVEVVRFGYAVEYDYAPPTQLHPTLETKVVRGLFLAGQLNGTSGYEEAAFQGLMAGINAGLQVRGQPSLVLGRHEAHGAVLLDELVQRGVDEPFRMMTSRSEHRLTLREGNAEFRLRAYGHRVGLVDDVALATTQSRAETIARDIERLETTGLSASLRRPEVRWVDLPHPPLPEDLAEEVETTVKYAGYVKQAEVSWARQQEAFETLRIPQGFSFRGLSGLSREAQDRLEAAQPSTYGVACTVPGVTPAALTLLLAYLRRAACGERVEKL